MSYLRTLLHYTSYIRPVFTFKSLKYCNNITNICEDDSKKTKKRNNFDRHVLKVFGGHLLECLPKYVQKVQITFTGELEIMVVPEGILCATQFLKDHHNCQFEVLCDVTGMDVPSRIYRFELIYNLLSLRFNSRVRVSFKHNSFRRRNILFFRLKRIQMSSLQLIPYVKYMRMLIGWKEKCGICTEFFLLTILI